MDNRFKFDISELEQLMWKAALETFQQGMIELLSTIDVFLMANRDQERYELKEKKERTYVTMIGPITIKRRYYFDRDEKKWVYLLDEALNLEDGQVSACLKELVVLWATKGPSYRDVQERLKDLYGYQVLSHEKIRQILIQSSEALKNTFYEEPAKKKHVDTIFIEADGYWTGVQHKGRRARKKRETHLVVVHEGWERRQGKGDKADYKLKNPMYTTVIANSKEDIWEQVWLRLASKYEDLNRIRFIINGDFASWIRGGIEHFKNAFYQYDRFHLKKEIKQVLRGSKYLAQALERVDQNDPRELLETISKAITEASNLDDKKEMRELKKRLQKAGDAPIDYRQRLREQGIEIPSTWRGMGAAESNVDLFKLRTAKRGRSWSNKGLEAIQHMLGLLYEDILHRSIKQLDVFIKEGVDTEKLVSTSANQIAKTVGRDTFGVHQGGFPAIHRGTSQGFAKLFRSILNPCPAE